MENKEYQQSLKKQYPEVNPVYFNSYLPPQTDLWVNQYDSSLEKINIAFVIPTPPPVDEIDGFGLPYTEQKFKRPIMPNRLQKLVERHEVIEEVWKELEINAKYYKDEINWIDKQWDRILNGYWFYRAGQPIYLHGYHYAYCSYWEMDVGLPEYRDRDRKFFLFGEYCYTDTRTFALLNHNGKPIKNSDDYYDFIDVGVRVCAGFNYPKHRREGATYKAACYNYFFTITKIKCHSGIQAMDDITARQVFSKKLIEPWKSLPFFLKPNYAGSTDPVKRIEFKQQATKISSKKGALLSAGIGLNSFIDYATTADRNFYDSERLGFFHEDECGKTIRENVYERHHVTLQCLLEGRIITGLTIKTSTVGETKKRGGAAFKQLVMDSRWEDRTANGSTKSSLYTLFVPAYDGLKGFVDQYGRSVIDKPTEEQAIFIKSTIGAREYLENTAAAYLKAGNIEAYNQHCRQFPTKLKHCFIGDQLESGFNLMIIHNRIDELDGSPGACNRGNFEWVTGRDHHRPVVKWETRDDGRWWISYIPPSNQTNLIYKRDGVWYPTHPFKFISSSDPFRFNKTEAKRKSDGAGATFWEHDEQTDPIQNDVSEWQSNRFVCAYLTRVANKDLYADDMLKQNIFFGGEQYPEMNIDVVVDYFIKYGYGGFLRYDIDSATGKSKTNPGYYIGNNEKVKNLMFAEMMQYVEIHGRRERISKILEQCRDIEGIETLRDYDLFAACGGCLLGRRSGGGELKEFNNPGNAPTSPYSVNDIFELY
jgi:hypothetical protein